MDKKFKTLKANDSIHEAVKLLTKIPEAAVPVVGSGRKIVGEISQQKLLLLDIGDQESNEGGLGFLRIRNLMAKRAKKVKDLMSTHEFVVSPEDDVMKAIKFLYEEEISTIPVVDSKRKLVGVITDIGVLKHHRKILGKKSVKKKSTKRKVAKKKTAKKVVKKKSKSRSKKR